WRSGRHPDLPDKTPAVPQSTDGCSICGAHEAPRYLIHDRDHAFDGFKATAKAMGIEEVVTAPHAPWQNPFVERFVGSARRECFDHVIPFNEGGVQKLMTRYGSYYEKARTHLALNKDAPIPRP